MLTEAVAQFCEYIDIAINTINEILDNRIEDTIDKLCSDICFWDSNTEISRKYLSPLKGMKREDVITGLEYVKTMYSKKGDPTFHHW